MIHPSDKALFSFQSTLEVVLTPITERYLGFTPMQNAYVYGITGGVSSLGYISLLGIVFFINNHYTNNLNINITVLIPEYPVLDGTGTHPLNGTLTKWVY